MFSRASSRGSSGSIHRLLSDVKSLSSRPPFNKSQPSSSVASSPSSSSSSSLSSSVGRFGYGGSHNGRSGSDKTLDLLLRSVSSGVLILGTSLGFSYWSSSSLDPNSYVSYADNCPKEAAFAIGEDTNKTQFSLFDGTLFVSLFSSTYLCIVFSEVSVMFYPDGCRLSFI